MKVGDTVLFGRIQHGETSTWQTSLIATLIEDRGFIGVGGRRLWRLRDGSGSEFEAPEVELMVVSFVQNDRSETEGT